MLHQVVEDVVPGMPLVGFRLQVSTVTPNVMQHFLKQKLQHQGITAQKVVLMSLTKIALEQKL